jgi:hypothetical protein
MKNKFFCCLPSQARKNGRRIASINHDLAWTLTLPTPQNRLRNKLASVTVGWRSSSHDA